MALLDRQPQGAAWQVHPPPSAGRQDQPQDGHGHHHLLQVPGPPLGPTEMVEFRCPLLVLR